MVIVDEQGKGLFKEKEKDRKRIILMKKKTNINRLRTVQGVPQVRSSLLSKLYFYMKFLKDVYYSIE